MGKPFVAFSGQFLDGVFYAALAAGSAVVLLAERQDTQCPTFTATEQECRDDGGMAYAGTEPKPGDTPAVLISKMVKAGTAYQNAVRWRIFFLLSVAAALLLWFLVLTPGSLPDWQTFAYTLVTIGVVLIGVNMWYAYHVFKRPHDNVEKAADALRAAVGVSQN